MAKPKNQTCYLEVEEISKNTGEPQGSEERERSPETKEEPRGQHPLIQQEFEEDQREGVGNIFCARENAFSDRPTRFQVE